MARDDPQLKIRLPVELKESIESAAEAADRSMNAEIVQRLEASLEAGDVLLDLQRELTALRMGSIQDRHRARTYLLVLSMLAERIPKGTFKDAELIEEVLDGLRGTRNALVHDLANDMLEDITEAMRSFQGDIKSGAVKVISSETGKPIPPNKVKMTDFDKLRKRRT